MMYIAPTYTGVVRDLTRPAPGPDLSTRTAMDALQARIDHQNLLIQTLLMLLLEKKVLAEDEFREWMRYVDNLDGRADGKLSESKAPQTCPECGRKNSPQAIRCQYCGKDFPERFLDRRLEQQSEQQPGE